MIFLLPLLHCCHCPEAAIRITTSGSEAPEIPHPAPAQLLISFQLMKNAFKFDHELLEDDKKTNRNKVSHSKLSYLWSNGWCVWYQHSNQEIIMMIPTYHKHCNIGGMNLTTNSCSFAVMPSWYNIYIFIQLKSCLVLIAKSKCDIHSPSLVLSNPKGNLCLLSN